jgi:hypothetical protein
LAQVIFLMIFLKRCDCVFIVKGKWRNCNFVSFCFQSKNSVSSLISAKKWILLLSHKNLPKILENVKHNNQTITDGLSRWHSAASIQSCEAVKSKKQQNEE